MGKWALIVQNDKCIFIRLTIKSVGRLENLVKSLHKHNVFEIHRYSIA